MRNSSGALAVATDGGPERARLRAVEVVRPAPDAERSVEVRLGVAAAVVRPRVQVAAGKAHIERAEAERAAHPRLVEGVGDRDLAELGVAAALDAFRRRTGEAAADVVEVPVLPDRHGQLGAGAHDGSLEDVAAEDLLVAGAHLFVVGVERARGALRDRKST